jgi:hypothetical protein
MAVLLLVVALAVAPYVRSLADQQSRLAALRADVASREANVRQLETQLERWQDPAFVKARARERLFMVMPGETGYVVLDPPSSGEVAPEDPAEVAQAAQAAAADGGAHSPRPWFGTLWESVQLAAAEPPPTDTAPSPGSGEGSGSSVSPASPPAP